MAAGHQAGAFPGLAASPDGQALSPCHAHAPPLPRPAPPRSPQVYAGPLAGGGRAVVLANFQTTYSQYPPPTSPCSGPKWACSPASGLRCEICMQVGGWVGDIDGGMV